MNKAGVLLVASGVTALAVGSPVFAQYQGTNEKEWAGSIQSAIRNGAPDEEICQSASIKAGISDEEAFKDWAYSVARKYCEEGYEKQSQAPAFSRAPAPTPTPTPECRLTQAQIYAVSIGQKTVARKGDCYMSFH